MGDEAEKKETPAEDKKPSATDAPDAPEKKTDTAAAKTDAPAVADKKKDTLTKEEAKEFLTKAYNTAEGAIKDAYKTVLDNVDEIYEGGKSLVVKDGKLDFTNLKGKVSDGLDAAGKTITDTYEAAAPSVGEFLGKNSNSIMGGMAMAMLLMGMLQMGPIASLVIGLIAFAAMSAMGADGDKGVVKGLMNAPEKKEEKKNEPGKGKGKGDETPGKDAEISVKLLGKDGKPIKARDDGTQVIELTTDTHAKEMIEFMKKHDATFANYVNAHQKEADQYAAILEKLDPKILVVGKTGEDGKFHITDDAIFVAEHDGKTAVTKLPFPDSDKAFHLNEKGKLTSSNKDFMDGTVEITGMKLLSDVPGDVKAILKAQQQADGAALEKEKMMLTELNPTSEELQAPKQGPKGKTTQQEKQK